MASSGEIKAGRAYVEITSKDAGLASGLARASARVQAFGAMVRTAGAAMAGVGAAVSAALAVAGSAFADTGDDLLRMSQRTGIAVESLSTLRAAARAMGSDAEALQTAVLKMDRTLVQAAGGSKEAEHALAQLGLTVGDLNNLTQEDRLKLISDRLSAVRDPAVQSAAGMQIFGGRVRELLPLLELGGRGISDLQAHARDLGLQWSTADAEAAARYAGAMRDLWAVLGRRARRRRRRRLLRRAVPRR